MKLKGSTLLSPETRMGATPVLSHGVAIPTIAGMKHHVFDHRHVLVPQCLKSKSRLTSSCSSSVGSGTESPVECEEVLHRSHSSPSSSLDSDIGSDNPDEQETLLRHNPGSGGLFDESNIRRVNLSAAFHDHLTLTKLNRELRNSHSLSSAFPFHAVSHSDNSSNLSSASFVSSGNNDKEQVDFLQDMVVTQLDLIDYQKEQLQKKDRQLLGLKQEREKLMSQLERIEKRCNSLNKKLSMYENNSAKSTDLLTGVKSKTTTSPPLDPERPVTPVDQILHTNSSCTVFQNQGPEQQTSDLTVDLKFKEQGVQVNPDMIRRSRANTASSTSSSKKKKLPPTQSIGSGTGQSAAAITQRGVSIDESSPVHQQPAKKKQRSSSIPVRIMDDMDSAGDSCESLSPTSPAEAITILLPKDFLSTTEEYEVVNMRELDVPRLKKQIDVLTPDCDTSSSRTPKLSLSSLENSPFFTENGINRLKRTDELIEVPSFRILTFSPLPSRDQDDEMLDDETFNRRHAKLEIDERRRKRWDMQRLREQKHTERLKQGRYYSSCAFIHPDAKIGAATTDLKPETEMISFFPDPMEAHMLEISEKIPVLAFGHPIPHLPPSYFSLPWKKKSILDPDHDSDLKTNL